jgi:hypothetical protein
MNLGAGDRVRVTSDGDDGLPLVRYGFIGGIAGPHGPVMVMLDGEIGSAVVELCDVQAVSITTVELCLTGDDLMDDPDLRRGLVGLWSAEADSAGLDVDSLHALGDGTGLRDSSDSWALAELTAGGESYVVRAFHLPNEPETVRVRADRPNRWDV